jgi:GNAT superfamily N-acetyltransferase
MTATYVGANVHPFHVEQLAADRRERLRQEAQKARLVRSANLTSTGRLHVRALRPADVEQLRALYDGLSPHSRFLRFMAPIRAVPVTVLQHLADVDHDRHEALGAFARTDLVAAAHWFRVDQDPHRAEVATEVTDIYQRRGVGSRLLQLLARQARAHGISEFRATLLAENAGAVALIRAAGWPVASSFNGAELTVTTRIDSSSRADRSMLPHLSADRGCASSQNACRAWLAGT